MALNWVFASAFAGMAFSGWVATLAGWYVTEIGRQPWLVQGVLTTQEALGSVSGGMVFSTLLVYLGVYAFLTVAYIATLFHLAKNAADKEVAAVAPAA